MLQIAFKAVNHIAGPNSLVPTFFAFGTYFCIVTDLPTSLSEQQQAYALAKAINKLCKLKTQQKIQDALNT